MLTNAERETLKAAEELILRECANDGDRLIRKHFGTFKRVATKARTGRNPQAGVAVEIPAKSVLRFKATKGE